jgi:rifampin ADP-ribosyltransferase
VRVDLPQYPGLASLSLFGVKDCVAEGVALDLQAILSWFDVSHFKRSDRHMSEADSRFRQQFFHGTRADLRHGDLIATGYTSNYDEGKILSWVYCTGTLDAAIWGAELSVGSEPGKIYVVEPTGPIVDDPNLTDKKFPGNPTLSYRSREPLRVVGEVTKWQGHSSEQIRKMKGGLEHLKTERAEIID